MRCTCAWPTRRSASAPARSARATSNADAILEVARSTGAEAVHPGYGFFAEHAGFARACASAGLVFIGPPPEAIESMGVKTTARRLMEEAGVPVVPGTMEPLTSAEEALATARAIGFPVAFKTAGGGGRQGLSRRAHREAEGAAAFEQAASEGERFFANGDVYVERVPRGSAPRRGADPRRRARQRRPPRRARLLDPAAAPEARRGVARADRHARAARADLRDRRRGRARRRLPRRRHRRGAAGRRATTSSSR